MSNRRPERSVRVDRGDGCWRGQFQAMASPCEVLCEHDDRGLAENLSKLVAAEAWRIEDKFSRYLSGNIIDRINTAAGEPVEVDSETGQLLDFATTLTELSDGRFDISSGVLRRVWNFDGSDKLPDPAAISEVLSSVGWHRVKWESPLLHMPAGMQIDLGGMGKEYAVDRATALLRASTESSCLVNFGGDLAVTVKPGARESWKVGVEALDADESTADRLLNLGVGALATSGDARRYLFKDGVRYSHILDPSTGWPVPDAPRSVTVAADTCTQAGMLSTFAMLHGEGAEAFLDAQNVRYWCNR